MSRPMFSPPLVIVQPLSSWPSLLHLTSVLLELPRLSMPPPRAKQPIRFCALYVPGPSCPGLTSLRGSFLPALSSYLRKALYVHRQPSVEWRLCFYPLHWSQYQRMPAHYGQIVILPPPYPPSPSSLPGSLTHWLNFVVL